ncbi:MAG: glycosyltransferase [Bacteroidetes bacterium]|nr:glycosyltransferase [Bacteroidota bacterium]MCL5025009.1 glycosyltransferase [Chloroflexota bacterium]
MISSTPTFDHMGAGAEEPAQRPYTPIVYWPINYRLARQIPESFARARRLVPLARHGDMLSVAMADPDDAEALAELRRMMPHEIRPLLSSEGEIGVLLDRVFRPQEPANLLPALSRVLLDTGFLTSHQIATLEKENESRWPPKSGDQLGIGGLTEEDYAEALAFTFSVPHVRLDSYRISPAFAELLPREFAQRWQLVPMFAIDGKLVVASKDLLPNDVLATVARLTGFEPLPVIGTASAVAQAIARAYGQVRGNSKGTEKPSKPLWQQLLDSGFIEGAQVASAETIARQTGESVEGVLLRLGQVGETEILKARAELHNSQLVRLADVHIDRSVAAIVPEPVARRYRCLALHRAGPRVLVAMADLADSNTRNLLEVLFAQPVHAVLCSEADLQSAFEMVYGVSDGARGSVRPMLGEYLVQSGRLTPSQVAMGLQRQHQTGRVFGKCLIDLGLLSEAELAEVQGLQLRLPWVDVSRYVVPAETSFLLPQEIARQYGIAPLYREGRLLTVATSDPQNEDTLQVIRDQTGLNLRVVLAGETEIQEAIDRIYGTDLSAISQELLELGEQLTRAGLLRRDQMVQVWQRQLQAEMPFDTAVTTLGFLSEEQLASAIAVYLKVPQADLRYRRIPVEIIDGLGARRQVLRWTEPLEVETARLLPEHVARRCSAIPVSRAGDSITVAFVNPVESDTVATVQQQLRCPVSIVIATREQLAEAIRRVYNCRLLGDILLEADVINRRQLEEGMKLHRRSGVRLGKALISLGYLTQDQLVGCLSEQHNFPYFDLQGADIPEDIARSVPETVARSNELIPLSRRGDTLTVAMVNPLDTVAIEQIETLTGCRVEPVIATEEDIEDALERVYKGDYLWQSANDLVFRYPEESASRVLTSRQKVLLLGFLAVSILLMALKPVSYLTVLISLSTLFYVSFSSYKFYLIYKALSHSLEIPLLPEEIATLDDRDLPVYTVLVPVYREAEVLPTLIQAIDNMDYPKTKLDVQILLEEDDKETIAAVRRHQLPAHIKPVVVPNSLPKGKPKACNYGLIHAQGEYLVIYDAEDIPERDQLKKVVVAFRKARSNVECIQAKLNYYNRDQNLLTRWFTTEYSMWFDLFIPGLDASNAPIPLGGTSNHFRTARLRELGAWDPYNVTEDADLGVRLFKHGWKTAVIDSTTYEEANSQLYNWLRQRSRWVKGYIHTYLVHMRHPWKLMRDIGVYQFFSFNMVVGGTFFGFLLNPVYWLLTATWYITRLSLIEQIFPAPIYYLGALGLYLGNFAFMYTNVAGCMRRQYYDMVKYALLSPLYWALMSMGAWKGFIQLFYRPSYWEKTVHGLYRGEVKVGVQASETTETH